MLTRSAVVDYIHDPSFRFKHLQKVEKLELFYVRYRSTQQATVTRSCRNHSDEVRRDRLHIWPKCQLQTPSKTREIQLKSNSVRDPKSWRIFLKLCMQGRMDPNNIPPKLQLRTPSKPRDTERYKQTDTHTDRATCTSVSPRPDGRAKKRC